MPGSLHCLSFGFEPSQTLSVGPGGWGEICSSGSARAVLGEPSPSVSKRLAGLLIVVPKPRGRELMGSYFFGVTLIGSSSPFQVEEAGLALRLSRSSCWLLNAFFVDVIKYCL